jgi:arylsulfatase A-like enzyme
MNDHKMVDYAVEYLQRKHEKPFFLACGLFRPHMPWQVPRKYYDMYPPEKITLPDVPTNDLDDVPAAGVKMARPKGDHATMLRTGNWRHAVQAYLASISFADAEVGRLMKALDASPYSGNTVVVLWGDHGWHLGEKSHWRKFSLWEEATRAPLIMVAPGLTKPGSVCRRTVDFMHIYPTLAELCGLPIIDQLEGRSMLPLLMDPTAEWKLPAITTHGRNNHAVRSERWRYIRYANGDEELYDHDADPMEWTNLASKSQFAKVKQELAAWLPKNNAANAPFDKNTGARKTKKKKTP